MLCCDNTSNKRFEDPATPIIPDPSKVNNEMASICVIPLIGLVCASGWLDIRVPIASGSKVFLIQIGIAAFNTGCIVGGYNTLAPKCDNSIASWYEIDSIGCACFTIFGLAVNIPFTSVQISSDRALTPLASIAAV